MSIAEVKNLRNQNKFEEAEKMSGLDLEAKPDDIWLKRNHAWSLYYMIKKHVQAGESEQAKRYYSNFESLSMPQDEVLIYERMAYFKRVLSENFISAKKMIEEGRFEEAFDLHANDENVKSEQIAWALYYLARNQNKSKNPDKAAFLSRLEVFTNKAEPQHQLVYKLLVQEVMKLPLEYWTSRSMTWDLEFLGLFDALDPEDFEKQEYEGKKLISLAERLHIAYSKALIREKASPEKVKHYLSAVVEVLLESHRGMLYVPYFKAKLLLEIGDRKEGMEAFLPFARKKQGEFWVWQVFAEYYQEEQELYLSCLCKALDCKVKPEFLSGIKERLIAHLIRVRDFDWAKSELDHLLQIREKQGWGMRTSHRSDLAAAWYVQSKGISLKGKYEGYKGKAEELLGVGFGVGSVKIPIVVEFINEDKRVFSFVTKDQVKGFGKYTKKPELGELYVLEGSAGEGGFYKVDQLKEFLDVESMLHLRKMVTGKLKQLNGKPFGFVEGVFVTPALIQQYKLIADQPIEGVALYGAVKGKAEMSWRMISIKK
jgi:hypothetical protein